MTRSIIGACLNCSVISKTAQEIHAVLHAAADAKSGYSQNLLQANISCKVAIVRGNGWIAVTFMEIQRRIISLIINAWVLALCIYRKV